jgi:hypothetical protein
MRERHYMGRTKADVNSLDMGISFVYLVGKKETKRPTRKKNENGEDQRIKRQESVFDAMKQIEVNSICSLMSQG